MKIKPRFILFLFIIILIFIVIFITNNLIIEQNKTLEYQNKHNEFQKNIQNLNDEIEKYKNENKEQQTILNELLTYEQSLKEFKEKLDNSDIFKVTSYDLSIQSCGKAITSRGYGLTRTGFDLRGKNWREARTIACDPNVIPLGSRVYIKFLDENYKIYNNVYIANDTGSAIKGNRIDLFQGDFESYYPHKITIDFGITEAKIVILD